MNYFILISIGYILQVSTDEVIVSAQQKLQKTIGKLYRIDKDETLNNLSVPLTNLANLFKVNSIPDEKLRQCIIHNRKPEFHDEVPEIDAEIIDGYMIDVLERFFKSSI